MRVAATFLLKQQIQLSPKIIIFIVKLIILLNERSLKFSFVLCREKRVNDRNTIEREKEGGRTRESMSWSACIKLEKESLILRK